jgi:hypothetical protein
MDIGNLLVSIGADVARIQRDMEDAKTAVGGSMAEIERYVGYAKDALIGFTGIASADAFKNMIEGSLKAVAGLHELSIQTGATVESMSALIGVGKLTGTTGEDIAGMMNKLAKNMAVANEESKGAGQAIAALGLNFEEFRAMSPDEKMVALAEAMNEYADGSDKSAVAMTLLGRSGAQALPFLKELAETQSLQARVTTEQATQAHQFEQDLARLTVSGEAWKKELALGMLPALQEAATATLGLVNESGGLRDEIKRLAEDGSIAEWTRGAIVGFTYVMDGFSYLKDLVQSVGIVVANFVTGFLDGLGTLGTVIVKVIKGQYGDAMSEVVDWNDRARERDKLLDASMKETWGGDTLGQRLRDRIKDVQAVGVVVDEDKKKLDFNSDSIDKNTKALKDQQDAEDKWIASVEAKIGVMQDQLEYGEKQTESDKLQNQLLAELANGTLVLTDKQLDARLEAINDMQTTEEVVAADKDLKKAIDDMVKAHDDNAAALEKETATMQGANDKLTDQILAVALGKDGFMKLTVQRLLDEAAQKEQTAATSDQSDELLKQAAILRERAVLVQNNVIVKEAHDAAVEWAKTTKSIGEDLTNALTAGWESGKSTFVIFRDWLLGEFKKMVLSPTINFLVNPIAGAVNNALSGLTNGLIGNTAAGAATGAAGGSAVGATGGTGLLSGLGSSISNLFGGGASGAMATGASGVTSAGVLGGGSSAAIGTNLGALGAEGSAATGGLGGLESLTFVPGIGWAIGGFLLGAAIIGGNAHYDIQHNASATATFDASGKLISSGPFGSAPVSGAAMDWVNALESRYLAQHGGVSPSGQTTWSIDDFYNKTVGRSGATVGFNGYQVGDTFLDGMAAQSILIFADQAMRGPVTAQIEGFASGGDFMGGLRLVGERGPELEVTGPSRIFDAATTASMLRSGGASNDELVTEMRLLREEVRGLRAEAQNTGNQIASSVRKSTEITINNPSRSEVSVS